MYKKMNIKAYENKLAWQSHDVNRAAVPPKLLYNKRLIIISRIVESKKIFPLFPVLISEIEKRLYHYAMKVLFRLVPLHIFNQSR